MNTVLILIAFVVTNVFLYVSLRKKTEVASEPLHNFICPYCNNVVTGFKELDRVYHVSCIDKSKEDLEAEKKKSQTSDKYHTVYDYYTSYTSRTGAWMYKDYQYHQYVVTVYRNGKEIAKEAIGTYRKSLAEQKAADIITVDKHSRMAKV